MSKKTSARRKLDPIRVQMAEKTQRVKHDLAMKMVAERVKIDAEFAADVLKIGGENLRADIRKDAEATIANHNGEIMSKWTKIGEHDGKPILGVSEEAVHNLGKASYDTGLNAHVELDTHESSSHESCCGSCGCEKEHPYTLDKKGVREYMDKNGLTQMVSDGGCSSVDVPKEKLQAALEKLSDIQAKRLNPSGLT